MNSGRRTARQEEEFNVQRRNAELRKQEHWKGVADYFKAWDVKTSKFASWTSEDYFKHGEEARAQAENQEKKKRTLDERRDKLREVLGAEQKLHEEEAKNKRQRGACWMPLEDLKKVNLELKQKAEEASKREAELMLYQRWKQEQPTLRDLERRQQSEFMKKAWLDQVKEREAMRRKRIEEEAQRAKEEELKRKKEAEIKNMEWLKKEEEIKELKEQIKKQMQEIKSRSDICREIEIQEAKERRLQAEVEEMMLQRKLAELKQANKQLVSYWARQYTLKLQRKNKEMEEEISQDLKMLERLQKAFNDEMEAKARAKEIAKKEMNLALAELEKQRNREILRQKEYEHMYFEESKRAWEIQEKKWEQERLARDQLMKEVLDTVKKQIDEKIETNVAQRAKSMADREELMMEINKLYDECNRREEEMKLARQQYHKDLKEQIAQNQIKRNMEVQKESDYKREITLLDMQNERKLAQEMEKLKISNEAPPDFRRRRVVW